MRYAVCLSLLLVLAGVSSCAKPVTPITDKSEGATAASMIASPDGREPRAFRVLLEFVGPRVTLDPNGLPIVDPRAHYYVTPRPPGDASMDTVAAYSILRRIRWRPLTAPASERVDSELDTDVEGSPWSPSAGESLKIFAPGIHELVLKAPRRAGGGTVNVRFFCGFVPTTWWAGPDPSRWPVSTDGDGRGVEVTDWSHFTTVPAWPPDGRGYYGPDSLLFLPSRRLPPGGSLERRTFYEIYGNRIYARAEGDSVHQGSWVVLCNGGYDKDSPYVPRVDASDPALPPGFPSDPSLYPVLLPQGLAGSPIGFRSRLSIKLPNGNIFRTAQTALYPVFDPFSVFRETHLMGYWPMQFPGKAYVVARAEDSHGLMDPPILDPVALADLVDSGGGTPADRLLRRKILTFTVRSAPGPLMAEGASNRAR